MVRLARARARARARPRLLALAALVAAMPAAAAPNLVMRSADRIELVRDLSNEAAFERDGQYYDLGYLYSTERINGAEVATRNQGFVLYHDDRYARLEPDDLSSIEMALGEDPTEGYTPPAAARAGVRADPAPAAAAAPSASTRHRSGGAGWLVVFPAFLFLLAVRWARNAAVRGAIGLALNRRAAATPAPAPARANGAMPTQAAPRRARLDALSPPAREFGRKAVQIRP